MTFPTSYSRRRVLTLAAATACLAPLPVFGDTRGDQIARDRFARDTGWRDSTEDAQMILSVPGRGKSVREMSIKALETSGDGDLSLTEFSKPLDLDGTLFLSHSHATKPDDQWLYLPAQGKARRISSSNKSGAFLGSEFTFEDLSSFKVPKYRYSYEGDGTAGGTNCHIVTQVPVYPHTGYKQVTVWLDTKHLRPMQATFYDRRGKHFKTMTFASYKSYGRFWRAHSVEMQNLENGRSTVMRFSKIAFGIGLSTSEFEPSRLG
jgi:hypothetical protein